MKTLHYSIIAFLLVIVLFPDNVILAQNETQPQIEFEHASYFTKKMNCNFYNTGKISPQDQEQKKATMIVTDPNANKFSTSIDRVTVFVWSDSDKKGIEITAYETEVNSGIFKGTVTISEGQSTQDIIHVSDGDTLSARYASTTPWSLYTTNHGVTTTAFIGATCPPLERVPASGIQVTDNKGNEQKTILADKQIQIGSNLTNVTIRNQTFTYIVQIQDKNGSTASFAWLSGTMLPNQTFSPSVSWTPSKVGNYVVTIFVWQSLTNPNALSPPISIDLTVLHDFTTYPKPPISNSEKLHCKLGFELMIKPTDGSPACVTPSTAQKLAERGWAKEIVSTPVTTTSNMKPVIQNYTGYQTKIIPGPLVLSSCGGGGYHSFSNILNSTGFHVFYDITNSSTGFNDDYVIEPGHTGTITYVIDAGSSPTPYMKNLYFKKELDITNYAVFYHYVTDYEELLHNPSVTIHNGDYGSCFKRPNGSCAGLSGSIAGPIQASVVDHPGVNVSFDPASELLQYNDTSKGKSSQIITMTVSVDYNAPQGTYWVVLSPEECEGGKIFHLTVGNEQYHELNR